MCALLMGSAQPARAVPDLCGMAGLCFPQKNVAIPANGAVLVAMEPGVAVEIEVANEITGALVAGATLLISPGRMSWTPLEPPDPGRYLVNALDSHGGRIAEVMTFIAAQDRAWPVLISAASLSQITENTERACCTLDEGLGEVTEFFCVPTLETTYVLLDPGLSSASSLVTTNQYLFRYTVPAVSDAEQIMPWSTPATFQIYEMRDEYCYEIEAIDLVTGEIKPYPELSNRCVSHGQLAAPGQKQLPVPDAALSSALCPLPPAGLESKWCTLNEPHCAATVASRDCHFYGYTCLDDAYPGPGWQRTTEHGPRQPLDGLVDLVDQANDGGVDTGRDAGSDASMPASRGSAGCAILRRRTQAGPIHSIVGSLALFALLARRRRAR